jgi:hypothetical protein
MSSIEEEMRCSQKDYLMIVSAALEAALKTAFVGAGSPLHGNDSHSS